MSNLKIVAESLVNTLEEALEDIRAVDASHKFDEKLKDYAILLRIAQGIIAKST